MIIGGIVAGFALLAWAILTLIDNFRPPIKIWDASSCDGLVVELGTDTFAPSLSMLVIGTPAGWRLSDYLWTPAGCAGGDYILGCGENMVPHERAILRALERYRARALPTARTMGGGR